MIYELKAYAKLNLYLDILEKRSDNYHEIRSIMQSVSLADDVRVTINEGDSIRVSCCTKYLSGENNIAYKAAKLFLEKTNNKADIFIEITKNIPEEAGLGGGSSDAAAVLRALSDYFGGVSNSQLTEIAAKIGADVPFCLVGGTKACYGIGEIIHDLPNIEECYFVIVKPLFAISTSTAFALYDEFGSLINPDFNHFKNSLMQNRFLGNTKYMYNVFEQFNNDYYFTEMKLNILNCGALKAMMTGSGSAFFGVFADKATAEKAYERLDYPYRFLTVPVTLDEEIRKVD